MGIAFVPTAGGLKNVYWINGQKAGFLMTWPPMKYLYKFLHMRVEHLEEMKIETRVRLEWAHAYYSQFESPIQLFFLSGGKSTAVKQAVMLMKGWLLKVKVNELDVATDSETLQTADKAEALILWIKKHGIENPLVYIFTSWYHIPRCKYEIWRASRKHAVKVKMKSIPVYPPFSKECLKYEYAYNLLAEPVKLVVMFLPASFKKWYGKKEKKARGL